jgi:hypothetical protein
LEVKSCDLRQNGKISSPGIFESFAAARDVFMPQAHVWVFLK